MNIDFTNTLNPHTTLKEYYQTDTNTEHLTTLLQETQALFQNILDYLAIQKTGEDNARSLDLDRSLASDLARSPDQKVSLRLFQAQTIQQKLNRQQKLLLQEITNHLKNTLNHEQQKVRTSNIIANNPTLAFYNTHYTTNKINKFVASDLIANYLISSSSKAKDSPEVLIHPITQKRLFLYHLHLLFTQSPDPQQQLELKKMEQFYTSFPEAKFIIGTHSEHEQQVDIQNASEHAILTKFFNSQTFHDTLNQHENNLYNLSQRLTPSLTKEDAKKLRNALDELSNVPQYNYLRLTSNYQHSQWAIYFVSKYHNYLTPDTVQLFINTQLANYPDTQSLYKKATQFQKTYQQLQQDQTNIRISQKDLEFYKYNPHILRTKSIEFQSAVAIARSEINQPTKPKPSQKRAAEQIAKLKAQSLT